MFGKIEYAIKQLQRGDFIIVVDDENRENEGDLVLAAELATPSKLNYFLRNAGGLMCIPITDKRLKELDIPMMVENPTDKLGTPFTVSIDATKNTTTGMSVNDRLETIKVLLDENSKPEDLSRPGHLFPLKSKENGVLEREGHTEAAVDLCKLANLKPIAIIAEIMNEDGSMAKLPDLETFAKKHKLEIYSIRDLIEYRKSKI